MALPIVDTPRYELTLPSTDVKVEYRPFLVKEEKVLYMALESGDEKEMQTATKEILKSVTFDKLNVEELPTFDVEYIFLQVRAKSVGEIAKFRVVCPDDMETYANVEVDISKVEVQVDDSHTNRVMLDESRNLGVVFAYPTMGVTQVTNDITNAKTEEIFEIIYSCVDHIFEGEKIYPGKDTSRDEMVEFFDSISQESLVDIRKFFDTMPQLKHVMEVENPKTKVVSTVTFRGLSDFYPYASPITT